MELIKDVKRKHYEAVDLNEYSVKDKLYDALMNVRVGAIEASNTLNNLLDQTEGHVNKHYSKADHYMDSFLTDLQKAAKEAVIEDKDS